MSLIATTEMEVRGRAIIVSGSRRFLVTEINSIAPAVLGCVVGFRPITVQGLSPYRFGQCTAVYARRCIDLLISLRNAVIHMLL